MLNIKSAYRDFKRLKDIVSIAFRCGLGYYIEKLKLRHHLFLHQTTKGGFEKPEDLPRRLRVAMDELGGSFVKLGQLLSLRPDLIPDEYCEEFSRLQDEVTPFDFSEVRKIVEEELKHKIEEIFSHFDEKPVASASIGQVHIAKLLNGEKIVVKVQRPNIKDKMEADIDILNYLAELAERHLDSFRNYNFKEIVKEFERYTKNELDYLREGRNIDRFYKNFLDDKSVKTPRVYWDYTTKRVLMMSYIQGVEIDDKEGLEDINADVHIVANNLARSFLRQVFEFGFFHADPHPANIFVLSGNRIAFLDYGIVGSLDSVLKERLVNFLVALVHKNIPMVVQGFLDMGVLEERSKELESDICMIIEEYANATIEQVDVPHLFSELMFVATRHRFRLPVDFVLLAKASITAEGVGQGLDPDFNLSSCLKEYVDRITIRKLRPRNIVKSLMKSFEEFRYNMKVLPKQTSDILERLKRGELKVQFEHKDLRELEKELDRSSNRVSMGVVISALIIASAIVLQISGGKWLAILGFGIALLLSMMLTISILKEGRIKI